MQASRSMSWSTQQQQQEVWDSTSKPLSQQQAVQAPVSYNSLGVPPISMSRSMSHTVTRMSSSEADSDRSGMNMGGMTRAKSDYLDGTKLEKTISKKQMKT